MKVLSLFAISFAVFVGSVFGQAPTPSAPPQSGASGAAAAPRTMGKGHCKHHQQKCGKKHERRCVWHMNKPGGKLVCRKAGHRCPGGHWTKQGENLVCVKKGAKGAGAGMMSGNASAPRQGSQQ